MQLAHAVHATQPLCLMPDMVAQPQSATAPACLSTRLSTHRLLLCWRRLLGRRLGRPGLLLRRRLLLGLGRLLLGRGLHLGLAAVAHCGASRREEEWGVPVGPQSLGQGSCQSGCRTSLRACLAWEHGSAADPPLARPPATAPEPPCEVPLPLAALRVRQPCEGSSPLPCCSAAGLSRGGAYRQGRFRAGTLATRLVGRLSCWAHAGPL